MCGWQNQTLVPTAKFGIIAGEAADAIFNATTLPGRIGGRHHAGEETSMRC